MILYRYRLYRYRITLSRVHALPKWIPTGPRRQSRSSSRGPRPRRLVAPARTTTRSRSRDDRPSAGDHATPAAWRPGWIEPARERAVAHVNNTGHRRLKRHRNQPRDVPRSVLRAALVTSISAIGFMEVSVALVTIKVAHSTRRLPASHLARAVAWDPTDRPRRRRARSHCGGSAPSTARGCRFRPVAPGHRAARSSGARGAPTPRRRGVL